MNKLITFLAALLVTSPAFASIDHWTCSNDQTVLYFILNTEAGDFLLFDNNGQFLAASKFTQKETTKKCIPFLVADLGTTMVAVAKNGDNSLILAVTNSKNEPVKFLCN